jgi:hypothetical protein
VWSQVAMDGEVILTPHVYSISDYLYKMYRVASE